MEMCYDGALVMPSSYAVMDEEEMMYVEGGKFSWAAAKGLAVTALTAVVSGIVGYGVKKSCIGAAMKAAGAWVANVIDTTIIAIMCYPGKAAAIAFGVVALGCIGYAVYKVGKKKKYW